MERSAVTFFSWAALGYSFKFVWAPLVDRMPIPVLTPKLGRRRAWILAAQLAIVAAIGWMALVDPAGEGFQLHLMAAAAVLLGFSSATQDIAIDAYRIESAGASLQAMMASAYIAGYRVGMLVSGAGALFLAALFGSSKGTYNYQAWQLTYGIMAAMMAVGMATVFIVPEPDTGIARNTAPPVSGHGRSFLVFLLAAAGFVGWFAFTANLAPTMKNSVGQWTANPHLAGFIVETVRLAGGISTAFGVAWGLAAMGWVDREMVQTTYIDPVSEFFNRYGMAVSCLLLALIGLYRISDIVLGVISNVFYQDLGFTKTQIAGVVKTFGLFMTIAGGFFGGALTLRYGVMPILFIGALLAALTNLLFVAMAQGAPDIVMLYLVISADNLAAGLASAAFVAFLSSLTNIRFTAIQYAVFSSLMTLIPKVFSGYSGALVDSMGYASFFMLTTVMGLPVLVLVVICGKVLKPGRDPDPEDSF